MRMRLGPHDDPHRRRTRRRAGPGCSGTPVASRQFASKQLPDIGTRQPLDPGEAGRHLVRGEVPAAPPGQILGVHALWRHHPRERGF